MQRLFLACFMAAMCLAVQGQRRLVVVDLETRVPIRGVNVASSAHRTDTTDWQGIITVPDSCRTLAFSHVNYESRILNVSEVRDTVFLITKLMSLHEVVVYGKGKDEDKLKELRKRLRIDRTEAQLAAADPSRGGNLLSLIGMLFKHHHKETRKERFKRILEEY
jgi:hypothetical protein